jgi:uncharacterized protein (DUF2336 family)
MFASVLRADSDEPSDSGFDLMQKDATPAVRGDLAGAVAAALFSGILSAAERRSAAQILELLARDVDRQVREAVAAHLQNCGSLPAPLARDLADEIDTVALPVIQYARLLTDPDLIDIVRRGSTARQIAVARRESLAEPVSGELVETRKAEVVGVLLANGGAALSEPALLRTLDCFERNEDIHALLVARRTLPMTVVHALIARTSAQLRDRLIERHRLPYDLAAQLVFLGQERAIAAAVAAAAEPSALRRAVGRLHVLKALTPTLLLRLLFQGDLGFFAEAMAVLTGTARSDIEGIFEVADWRRFRDLYRRAGLPISLFAAFRIAVDADRQDGQAPTNLRRTTLPSAMLDRLVETYADVCPAGIEHVLTQLARQPGAVSLPPSPAFAGVDDLVARAFG